MPPKQKSASERTVSDSDYTAAKILCSLHQIPPPQFTAQPQNNPSKALHPSTRKRPAKKPPKETGSSPEKRLCWINRNPPISSPERPQTKQLPRDWVLCSGAHQPAWSRSTISTAQRARLSGFYLNETSKPNSEQIQALAEGTGLAEKTIRFWFANQRQRNPQPSEPETSTTQVAMGNLGK